MKPKKDQKEYESHNYDAYNAAIDLVLAQHRLLNHRIKLANRNRPVITPCRLVASCVGAELQGQPASLSAIFQVNRVGTLADLSH